MWRGIWFCSLIGFSIAGLERKFINFGGFICPREDRALGRCLRDSLNAYIPQLAKGVPEYGLPPCEPLLVPTISVDQSTGAIRVNSVYSDVTVNGPSSMHIKDISVHSRKNKVVARVHIPELTMKGKYKIKGQVLMLPIEGEGTFSGTYDDIDAKVTIKLGRLPRNNGVDALKCEDLDVKFHIGDATIHLDNLFGGGDNDLGAAMNKFLNENWQELANELQAPMEIALRDFLKPLADHAFANLNADDILGDD